MRQPINCSRALVFEDKKTARAEMELLGCDPRGIAIMEDKSVFYKIKITNLTPGQANIIKQEMLSLGGEGANHYKTINCKIEKTDIIIFGREKELHLLAKKLQHNPFGLPDIGKLIRETLKKFSSHPLSIKFNNGKIFDFSKKSYIMGILNVTPDSFSDGGKFYSKDSAFKHAMDMIENGADIIDIGGESTRPGSTSIDLEEELRRVIPVIKMIRKESNAIISIDTQKSDVVRKALIEGVDMINDVSGMRNDPKIAKLALKYGAKVILMHMKGVPKNMQLSPKYNDIMGEIYLFLHERVEFLRKTGILLSNIIVDPGFGFGKSVDDNYTILRRLKEFKSLGLPILVGTSRKSMIGAADQSPLDDRLAGSIATATIALFNGANIVRVHDVCEMRQAAKVIDMMKN